MIKPNIQIRALTENDTPMVTELDDLAIQNVANMLDCENYAYGLFFEHQLVAYCTIGGADCCETSMIVNHPAYQDDSLLLSDVFTIPEYRNKQFASRLIHHVLQLHAPEGNPTVFIQLLDDNLAKFYQCFGFTWCVHTCEYCMVRCPKH